MKTIWKYPLSVGDRQTVRMPANAEILTVQVQNGNPCLWALVSPGLPKQERIIEIFGTGHDVPTSLDVARKYLGTFQLLGGDLVFHVFEQLDVSGR